MFLTLRWVHCCLFHKSAWVRFKVWLYLKQDVRLWISLTCFEIFFFTWIIHWQRDWHCFVNLSQRLPPFPETGVEKWIYAANLENIVYKSGFISLCIVKHIIFISFCYKVADVMCFYSETGGFLPDRVSSLHEVAGLYLKLPSSRLSSLQIKSQLTKVQQSLLSNALIKCTDNYWSVAF